MPTDYDDYRMVWYGCHTRPRDPASSPPLGHAGAGTRTGAGGTPATTGVRAAGDPAERFDPRWALDPVRPLAPVRTLDPARASGTAPAGPAGRRRPAPAWRGCVAGLRRPRGAPVGAPAERAVRGTAAGDRGTAGGHRSGRQLRRPGHHTGPARVHRRPVAERL